jgi:hypothetical protein
LDIITTSTTDHWSLVKKTHQRTTDMPNNNSIGHVLWAAGLATLRPRAACRYRCRAAAAVLNATTTDSNTHNWGPSGNPRCVTRH